jgi:hypothetical protein
MAAACVWVLRDFFMYSSLKWNQIRPALGAIGDYPEAMTLAAVRPARAVGRVVMEQMPALAVVEDLG